LHTWGVTTVQDASVTNGAAEWMLWNRMAAAGDLQLRLFMMVGGDHVQDIPLFERAGHRLRVGPVKIMVTEAGISAEDLRASITAAHDAGRSVALHAVSEAEVALAVAALQAVPAWASKTEPDRIEHAASLPDPLLWDIAGVGATVVGQPALIYTRGDRYRLEHPRHQWPWLHRAAGIINAGVHYAGSSDAPLTDPAPALGFYAARRRRTRNGRLLSQREALSPEQAVAAFTGEPARAVGVDHELGQLRPGFLADVVIVDPDLVAASTDTPGPREVRATIFEGRVVWRRDR
jgi:predicted amidohydrolase YtcJ